MDVQNGKSVVLSEAKVIVLGQDEYKNYLVEMDMMRSGPNENNWDFQNVAEYAKTFVMSPILIAYVGNRLGDGHNHQERLDPETGEIVWSFRDGFSERPVGYITETRTETREDGYEWVVAKGVIWRFYNRELVDKLRRTGRMSVSVETNIFEARTDGNIEIFTRWDGLGVTILGDGVAPAVPGANIHALAALQNEVKRLSVKAAQKELPDEGAQSRKNLNEKGVNKPMSVLIENKTLIAQMQTKFDSFGYKVMSVSEDGVKVCLLDGKTGAAYTYAFAESDKGEVIADRIKSVALSAVFPFGEDDGIPVAVDAVVAELAAQRDAAVSERDTLRAEKDNLSTMLASMQEREKERRKKDAKTAAKQRLAETNENRAEEHRIPETAINSVLEAADNGEFANCEDAVAEAQKRVDSICMEEIRKIDKAIAEKTRAMTAKHYAFEGARVDQLGEGTLASLYAEMVKE